MAKPSPEALRAFTVRYAALRELAGKIADEAGLELGRAMADMVKDVFDMLAANLNAEGAAVVNEEQLARVLNEMDLQIAELGQAVDGAYRSAWTGQVKALKTGVPGVYASFNKASERKLLAAFDSWKSEFAERHFRNGLQAWRSNATGIVADIRGTVADALGKAEMNGWGPNQTAQELLRTGKFSKIGLESVTDPKFNENVRRMYTLGGTISDDDALIRRARAVARTEATAIRTQATLQWAKEAGFERFINMNMVPVSQVCKDANAAGPMTEEEWSRTFGLPPRHPQCDSDLAPWPGDYEADDETADIVAQALAEAGPVTAQ